MYNADLRDAESRHAGHVVEDTAKVVLRSVTARHLSSRGRGTLQLGMAERPLLTRLLVSCDQSTPGALAKVDTGQTILQSDLLSSEMLLDLKISTTSVVETYSQRIVCPSFHSWVIGNDHTLSPSHES